MPLATPGDPKFLDQVVAGLIAVHPDEYVLACRQLRERQQEDQRRLEEELKARRAGGEA